MLTFALDLSVFAIIAFCAWRGYNNGLLRGVFGIVALVISLFLASVIATAYSGEFNEMLNPFIGGVVDTALVEIMEEELIHDLSEYGDEVDTFVTSYMAVRRIGLSEAPAVRIAEMTTEDSGSGRTSSGFLSDLISDKLSSVIAFVAVFGIAFILLAIVFAVAGNLIGFVFSLPGLKIIDIVTGTVLGFMKGFIIVLTLATIVRYAGLLAVETLEGTSVLKYFVNNNLIANMLGV